MKNAILYTKAGVILLLFLSLSAFDWIEDINKTFSSALISENGGIPANDIATISQSVISIREKNLDLSADKMPFERLDVEEKEKGIVLLALKGTGKDISQPENSVDVTLSLNKVDYQGGNATITTGDTSHSMRIAASQLYGKPDDTTFEFIYLLVGSDNSVAYLSIISNEYKINEINYRGFEGTLLYPGKEQWKDWKSVYKIDFGYELPVTPEYKVQIKALKKKVSDVRDALIEAKTLKRKIKSAAGKAKRHTGTPEGIKARKEENSLNRELEALIPQSEKNLLRFYDYYNKVLEEYQRFLTTNFYTWLPQHIQDGSFNIEKGLKQVNKHMDSIHKDFLDFLPSAQKVQAARADSLKKYSDLTREPAIQELK